MDKLGIIHVCKDLFEYRFFKFKIKKVTQNTIWGSPQTKFNVNSFELNKYPDPNEPTKAYYLSSYYKTMEDALEYTKEEIDVYFDRPEILRVITHQIQGFRFYEIDGRLLPSVTSIISQKDNPALKKWKSKLTEEQVQAVQEYTSHRGTLVHFGCLKTYETETISQGGLEQESVNYLDQFPQMRNEIRVAGKLFSQFKQKFKLIPVALEKVVYNTKLGFAGRVDFQGYLDNGSKTKVLVDIKTSKQVWLNSAQMQLSAYNKALDNWADKLFVLLIHSGRTQISNVTIGANKPHWKFKEIKEDFNNFNLLLYPFKAMQDHILKGENQA